MTVQALNHRTSDIFFQSRVQNFCVSTIAKRIKVLRTSRMLTQVQLAALLNVKQNTISDLETGKSETMTAATLEALCRVLVTTPGFILYGSENELTLESHMQEAELVAIFRELPASAQSALLGSARLLREAIPARSPAQPLVTRSKPSSKTSSK